MYDSSQLLEIPCIVTEQYPKAFGKTVPDISLTEESTFVIEKKKFSMMTEETQTHFESLNKPQVSAHATRKFAPLNFDIYECIYFW